MQNSTSSEPGRATRIMFEGTPIFSGGRAVLYDSSRPVDAGKLALGRWIRRIAVNSATGALPEGFVLEVFIDDLASPVARIPLSEAARPGVRPLSLWVGEDQRLVMTLVAPGNRAPSDHLDLLVSVADPGNGEGNRVAAVESGREA